MVALLTGHCRLLRRVLYVDWRRAYPNEHLPLGAVGEPPDLLNRSLAMISNISFLVKRDSTQ